MVSLGHNELNLIDVITYPWSNLSAGLDNLWYSADDIVILLTIFNPVDVCHYACLLYYHIIHSGLIVGLHPANERHRYNVTPSLIGGCKPRISPVHLFIVNACNIKSIFNRHYFVVFR